MTTNAEAGMHVEPAGFWRRIGAGCFDTMLLLAMAVTLLLDIKAAVALAKAFGWASLQTLEAKALFWIALGLSWWLISTIVLPVLYYTIAEGAFGQTFGKALFSIRVVDDDGRPISYGRAFARLLTLPYAVLPLGLGLLWAALPPAKRAWHDYISATRVIVADE